MDWLGYVLMGLTAGWLVEWLFDYFYWRGKFERAEKAKTTAEEKLKSTENVLFLIRQDLSEAEGELKEVKLKLAKSMQELASLKTRMEGVSSAPEGVPGPASLSPGRNETQPVCPSTGEAALAAFPDTGPTDAKTRVPLSLAKTGKAARRTLPTFDRFRDAVFSAIGNLVPRFRNFWKGLFSWFWKRPPAGGNDGAPPLDPGKMNGRPPSTP